nr:MAG TPA: hypothetical protein [Caudoviricetes sp.]
MKQKAENKGAYVDYKGIRERSKRMNCTISEADFFTNHPNPFRVGYTALDINRYLQCTGGR